MLREAQRPSAGRHTWHQSTALRAGRGGNVGKALHEVRSSWIKERVLNAGTLGNKVITTGTTFRLFLFGVFWTL